MASKKSLIVSPTSTYDDSAERNVELSILTNWQPIVAAAGLFDARQDIATILMLGGQIGGYPPLKERIAARCRVWRYSDEEKYAPITNWEIQELNAMTLEEKRALKDWILAKNPNAVTGY